MNRADDTTEAAQKPIEGKNKFELQNKASDYFKLGEVGRYFLRLFGKKDPSKPRSFNLFLMHGINRISVVMFLLALIYLLVKKVIL